MRQTQRQARARDMGGQGAADRHVAGRERLVIVASSLDTMFEGYDVFVCGTLATIIARHFFPAVTEATRFLQMRATFGAGFSVRPLLFDYPGDRLGRRCTFLVAVALMSLVPVAAGVLPTGLRCMFAVVVMALAVMLVGLPETSGRPLD